MNNDLKFNEIYKQYYGAIYNHIYKHVNDIQVVPELTNDVFVKVAKHLQVFNPEKAKLITWLFNIAKNVLTDHYRYEAKRKALRDAQGIESDNVTNIGGGCFASTDGNVDSKELGVNISKALSELSPNLRAVAELFFIKDFSHKQICECLDIPLGTVKGYINRSRERLQIALKNDYAMMQC